MSCIQYCELRTFCGVKVTTLIREQLNQTLLEKFLTISSFVPINQDPSGYKNTGGYNPTQIA